MRPRRGFALLAALGLLVLLSVVGFEFSLRARARRLVAANVLEGDRARAAADAGIARTHARLVGLLARSNIVDPWADYVILPTDTVTLRDTRYAVALHDPAAKLHLNYASEAELRRLFGALRIDFGRADRLAQAICDWRDADDLRRARGAEREDYVRDGAVVTPSNTLFQRVEELRHLMGMTPALYRLVSDHLTVHGTGQVNLNTADRPVLLSLPGMTEQTVAVVLRRRASGRPVRSLEDLASDLPPGPRETFQAEIASLLPRATFETRELVAASDGWVDGSPVRARATALFARGGRNVFLVWRSTR
ncbi:MAG TPA: hypothetical protein VFT57_20090 [Gemmatimonadaceae bacterium]|nr:hypothetical protein [Gemmatimonadaceae bacterium]